MFELKVNLLLRKLMSKIKLQENFNHHNLYMCNKHNRIIIETFRQSDIYIVKYVAKSLNKFVLIYVIHVSSDSEITLLIIMNTNLQIIKNKCSQL